MAHQPFGTHTRLGLVANRLYSNTRRPEFDVVQYSCSRTCNCEAPGRGVSRARSSFWPMPPRHDDTIKYYYVDTNAQQAGPIFLPQLKTM